MLTLCHLVVVQLLPQESVVFRQATLLAHDVSYTLGEDLPVFLAFVCMQLYHFVVGSELGQNEDFALICTDMSKRNKLPAPL